MLHDCNRHCGYALGAFDSLSRGVPGRRRSTRKPQNGTRPKGFVLVGYFCVSARGGGSGASPLVEGLAAKPEL